MIVHGPLGYAYAAIPIRLAGRKRYGVYICMEDYKHETGVVAIGLARAIRKAWELCDREGRQACCLVVPNNIPFGRLGNVVGRWYGISFVNDTVDVELHARDFFAFQLALRRTRRSRGDTLAGASLM